MGRRERPSAARRLLTLWKLYARMDLLWVARDPRAVALTLASDLIRVLGAITGTFLLAERFGGIGRWSQPHVLFMLGYAMMVTGLPEVFFNYNVAYISRRVGRGQLDHTLIQPQPLWLTLLTEGFAPISGGAELVPGTVLLVATTAHGAFAVTAGSLALLAVNVLASSSIALAFTFLWGSLAFWAPRAAEELNSSSWRLLHGLKAFPLDGTHPALLGGLLTIVPVGFLAWYPCRALLGLDRAPLAPALTPLAAVAFIAAAIIVFRRGMRHYGHTGSQRYLAFGHRR
ncbi:MAG: ABC transporter permease [Chloroflexota bacterium]